MNAFEGYEPQLSWKHHDTSKNSSAGQIGSSRLSSRIVLRGQKKIIPMMDIPSRGSINTETTTAKDKTDIIKRGGI